MADSGTGTGWAAGVEPVERSAAGARTVYDRVAAVYDLTQNPFESRACWPALRLLAARPGERVLEIGPGTGHGLAALAAGTGPAGRVAGVDLYRPVPAQASPITRPPSRPASGPGTPIRI